MINNAYDLYQFLIKQGGLKPYENSHDINFKESLKSEFKIKTPKELVNITVEEFLLFFFNSSEVYSVMMSDVVKMFERAQATAEDGKNNIKLDIIFDRIKDKLKIDLSSFIEKQVNSTKIVQRISSGFKTNRNLWEMTKIFSDLNFENVPFVFFCYQKTKEEWEKLISFKKTGNIELDEGIDRIRFILNSYYQEYLYYTDGVAYGDLPLFKFNKEEELKVTSVIFKELNYSKLLTIERNYFTNNVINSINQVLSNQQNFEQAIQCIDDYFKKFDVVTIKERINLFKEYLKLPIWKLRHELYSIWVMSQIIDISDNLKINTQQGKLLFAFKPTHQARLEYKEADKDLSIDLWSELRTKTSIPLIGKGRTKGIQPDYTIVHGDSSKADDAIVVIECKQYKKASYSNFSKAMVDYSNVHKNAYVFLVNYGSLTSNFESKFSNQFSDNSKRSIAIGDFNPMLPNVIKEFKDSLKEKISPATGGNALKTKIPKNLNDKIENRGLFEFKEGFQVRLTWSEAIRDLDLYLECDDVTIYFRNRSSCISGNTISFGNDLKTIPRSNPLEYEAIDVQGYLKQNFEVYVSKFSTEVQGIGKSKAVVEVVYNNDVYYRFECPETLSSDRWNVFEVKNGILFEIKQ